MLPWHGRRRMTPTRWPRGSRSSIAKSQLRDDQERRLRARAANTHSQAMTSRTPLASGATLAFTSPNEGNAVRVRKRNLADGPGAIDQEILVQPCGGRLYRSSLNLAALSRKGEGTSRAS